MSSQPIMAIVTKVSTLLTWKNLSPFVSTEFMLTFTSWCNLRAQVGLRKTFTAFSIALIEVQLCLRQNPIMVALFPWSQWSARLKWFWFPDSQEFLKILHAVLYPLADFYTTIFFFSIPKRLYSWNTKRYFSSLPLVTYRRPIFWYYGVSLMFEKERFRHVLKTRNGYWYGQTNSVPINPEHLAPWKKKFRSSML